jgi:hypothetical protein
VHNPDLQPITGAGTTVFSPSGANLPVRLLSAQVLSL